jgi:hypothetical protein
MRPKVLRKDTLGKKADTSDESVACDWRDDTMAAPDTETCTAVLPSLATTNGMLIGISSPYRKTGLLHQKHRSHFGVDGDDVLVVQGSSRMRAAKDASRWGRGQA